MKHKTIIRFVHICTVRVAGIIVVLIVIAILGPRVAISADIQLIQSCVNNYNVISLFILFQWTIFCFSIECVLCKTISDFIWGVLVLFVIIINCTLDANSKFRSVVPNRLHVFAMLIYIIAINVIVFLNFAGNLFTEMLISGIIYFAIQWYCSHSSLRACLHFTNWLL